MEVLQLFRAMKSEDCADAMRARSEWNRCRPKNEGSLGFADFCSVLGACAAAVFSGGERAGGERDGSCSLAEKLRLLLFWLDQRCTTSAGSSELEEERQERALVAASARGDSERAASAGGAKALATVACCEIAHRHSPSPSSKGRGRRSVSPGSARAADALLLEPPLEQQLRQLFAYYCTCGDRLNVGPNALDVYQRTAFRDAKNAKLSLWFQEEKKTRASLVGLFIIPHAAAAQKKTL